MLSSPVIVVGWNNSLLKIAGGCEGLWRRKKEGNLLIHVLILDSFQNQNFDEVFREVFVKTLFERGWVLKAVETKKFSYVFKPSS